MQYLAKLSFLSILACGVFMGLSPVFATEIDDTLCYGLDKEVDAGIIVVDALETKFVKCFKGRVLQPVGGEMIYTDTIDYQNGKKPSPVQGRNDIRALGYSDIYGPVYKLKDTKQITKTDEEEPVFGTATATDTGPSSTQYVLRILLALLVLYALVMFMRKEDNSSER